MICHQMGEKKMLFKLLKTQGKSVGLDFLMTNIVQTSN
jgi:hypothetical protein